jgi:hypothetical protein
MGSELGQPSVHDLTVVRLNCYAQSCGFDSETERLELYLMAEDKDPDAAWQWLETGGDKASLLAIIEQKRAVQPTEEEA